MGDDPIRTLALVVAITGGLFLFICFFQRAIMFFVGNWTVLWRLLEALFLVAVLGKLKRQREAQNNTFKAGQHV